MFVTFEGVDGSGKSTQAALAAAFLAEGGREVVAPREPGGTRLGERIRELLLDGPEMGAWAEASLFAAARAELAEEVIRPARSRACRPRDRRGHAPRRRARPAPPPRAIR